MTILVTGATGFIGKYVIKALLNRGHKVISSVRSADNCNFKHENQIIISGDLFTRDNIDQIKIHQPESCIHLAWEGIPDFSFDLCRRNLNYGLQLLPFCKEIGINTLMIAGSCWEYDNPVGSIPEFSPLSCENSFKATKNALRLLAEAYCNESGLNLYWLRLFYVYGPNQRFGSLIPHIINSIQNGRQPELKGAFNSNDFVYVQDVANAIIEVIETKPKEKIFNIGSGKAIKVIDILRLIANHMNFPLNLEIYTHNQASANFWADITKITQSTNWSPKTTIEQGLNQTIKYFKK